MFGKKIIEAFHDFKSIQDPDWLMNPCKITHKLGQSSNLRLGTFYNSLSPKTYFHYLNSDNKREFLLHEDGTMSPGYIVTHEEKDSAIGKAP